MAKSGPGAFFMHCLPAERGHEVTDEVIDDERTSLVIRTKDGKREGQADNRLHVQKAILELLLTQSDKK